MTLREWRMSRNLKQDCLAAYLGMGTRAIQNVEYQNKELRKLWLLALESVDRELTKNRS